MVVPTWGHKVTEPGEDCRLFVVKVEFLNKSQDILDIWNVSKYVFSTILEEETQLL